MNTELKLNVCERFYKNPTPANAVALAISDARALGNGTPDFFAYLARAEDQLRELESAKQSDAQ